MRILAFVLLLSLPTLAADPCVSGVPVGKRPGPYSFLVATGPERGQQTCFICEQEDKPAAVVFARSLSVPLGKLLAKLDQEALTRKDTGFKAWMTQLANKADLDALSQWSQNQGLKSVPVGTFEDADGPPAYLLAEDADVTVLLFVKEKVIANYAFRSKELNDKAIDEIMKTVPKLFTTK
jgi:hypothetical protein